MNTERILSLVRHTLTAIGTVLLVLGLGKYSGAIDYMLQNIDGVYAALMSIVGVFVNIWGFFKNRNATF